MGVTMDGQSANRQSAKGRAARCLSERLESLQQAGLTHLSKARPKQHAVIATTEGIVAAPGAAKTIADHVTAQAAVPVLPAATIPSAAAERTPLQAPAAIRPVPAAERPAKLEIIRREVAACTRCAELVSTRTQTVFGVGNLHARLMFIGEAPGADEDRQGEPFVGKAGQLLTKIIEACRLTREEVYIANILKCRPPGNRNPEPDEVKNCRGYLDRQLAIIRPEYICCLGAVAAKSLLNTEATIGRMRGRFYQYEGIPVLCTYHPAYLLRNPSAKRDVWEDMKLLMGRMGVTL
jgi:uracil-DNA glycosylase